MESGSLATFIDLFLISFIAIIILDATSPNSIPKTRNLHFSFTYNNSDKVDLNALVIIEASGDTYTSDDDAETLNLLVENGYISGYLKLPEDESEIVLSFYVKDDFNKLNNTRVNLKALINNNPEDLVLTREQFFSYSFNYYD